MPLDLAIDFNTGDLSVAPNGDVDQRTGKNLMDQRIRVRLKVVQGEWLLDPTAGTLGSRLRDATRLPVYRAVQEIPLLVREALVPMQDIDVTDVVCIPDEEDSRAVRMTIFYDIINDEGATTQEELTTTVTIAG